MIIPDKYKTIIIKSLESSIQHVIEWHQREGLAYRQETGNQYYYDYENKSIKPIQEALMAVKNTTKTKKRDESKSRKH